LLETVSKNGDEKKENVARKIASERWEVSAMTNKDPQPIQKIYPIIEFSEVSHSKGKIILPYLLSLKIDPLFWLFPRELQL